MRPSVRRWSLGLALSLAGHAVMVGGAVAILLLRGLSFGHPVDVEITGMRLDEVHDLPLGAPPGGGAPKEAHQRPKARHRAAKTAEPAGVLATATDERETEDQPGDRDAEAKAAPALGKDLRRYGPEGSRLTVLLRLGRLSATPYAPGLNTILQRLPDSRDLLEGTGLDFYRSFDTILIATPNPLDYAVTFLAARHHLTDAEMKATLDRGARATGRVLTWRTQAHRPYAERRALNPTPEASRDNRLLLLPAPGLVVVASPVYRSMLLAPAKPKPAPVVGPDGGTAESAGDAGAGDGGAAAGAHQGVQEDSWSALLGRIDSQEGLMPPGAVAMLSAVDMFNAPGVQHGPDVAPGAREPSPDGGGGSARQATILGMELPQALTVVIGVDPSPYVDLSAEFKTEDQALRWETEWPALHQRVQLNPYVVLTGFSTVIARTTLTREGTSIHIHQTLTEAETVRLLQLAPRLMVPQ